MTVNTNKKMFFSQVETNLGLRICHLLTLLAVVTCDDCWATLQTFIDIRDLPSRRLSDIHIVSLRIIETYYRF